MTADDWVKIIAAIGASVVVILGAVERNYRGIRRTHDLLNGRLDELLRLARESGLQEGRRVRRRRGLPAESGGAPGQDLAGGARPALPSERGG
jgi:hypothetical protein